ncbi:MOSC domain-containing protein [Deinococcus ruber]|uniref:Molybdenum cofactor biosysynthesis protein n=1 Tax=Deinococcus ruber TaxID=1848197 RepID=A0A918C2Q1_9DEIO|nr:MOSC domain-containing protein [Deinococcus ruber]GGR02600.1 molybdenum cofactor biosysynthesis protein [Deinococcus ruber]
MLTMQQLRESLPRPGRVEWAGLRSQRRGEVLSVPEVLAHPLVGLVGDHGKRVPARLKAINGSAGEVLVSRADQEAAEAPVTSYGGKRQVTLIQAEHLPVIAALAGLEQVTPEMLRRNIVISGLPLLALKDRRFRLGSDEHGWVLLEGTGECHPCSRMEETLGPGGYNAVRGHGGITARVLEGGSIRLGDLLTPL